MARLYANENFPYPVVEQLRRLGHDVLTIQETGKGGRALPDDDVLIFASQDKRALLTLNRKDFINLHGKNPHHFGIVACTFDPDFERQAQRVHDAINSTPQMEGKLMRVNRP